MRAQIYLTITLLLSINVLQPKKYLIEVAEDQTANSLKVENHDTEKTSIIGGSMGNMSIKSKI